MFQVTYKTRVYLHGLLAAVLNGIGNSVVVIMVDPKTFNLFDGGFTKLAVVALASGIFALFTYIKDHPLPSLDDTDGLRVAAEKIASIKVSSATGSGTGTGDGKS